MINVVTHDRQTVVQRNCSNAEASFHSFISMATNVLNTVRDMEMFFAIGRICTGLPPGIVSDLSLYLLITLTSPEVSDNCRLPLRLFLNYIALPYCIQEYKKFPYCCLSPNSIEFDYEMKNIPSSTSLFSFPPLLQQRPNIPVLPL